MKTYTLKSTLGRDGLTINERTLTIHQRTMGKGDITIPTSDITSVGTHIPPFSMPFVKKVGTLELRVGSKKYALRRLPISDLVEAETALREVMA